MEESHSVSSSRNAMHHCIVRGTRYHFQREEVSNGRTEEEVSKGERYSDIEQSQPGM
jgi:hypothetical protein